MTRRYPLVCDSQADTAPVLPDKVGDRIAIPKAWLWTSRVQKIKWTNLQNGRKRHRYLRKCYGKRWALRSCTRRWQEGKHQAGKMYVGDKTLIDRPTGDGGGALSTGTLPQIPTKDLLQVHLWESYAPL